MADKKCPITQNDCSKQECEWFMKIEKDNREICAIPLLAINISQMNNNKIAKQATKAKPITGSPRHVHTQDLG